MSKKSSKDDWRKFTKTSNRQMNRQRLKSLHKSEYFDNWQADKHQNIDKNNAGSCICLASQVAAFDRRREMVLKVVKLQCSDNGATSDGSIETVICVLDMQVALK